MIAIRPYRGGRGGAAVLEYDLTGTRADGVRFRERRRSPFKSERDTRRFAERRLRELLLTGPADRRAPPPTVAGFWPLYLAACTASGNRASTLEGKEAIFVRHLRPVIGELRLDAIGQSHVDEIVARCPPSASSRNNATSVLRTLLKAAVEHDLIPAPRLQFRWQRRLQLEMGLYSPAQFEELVAAARALDPRIELLVLLAGEAALRRGEIIALEASDLDLERGRITIARQQRRGRVGPPKGGDTWWLPVTDRLRDALRAAPRGPGPRVLTKPNGSPLTESTVRRWLARAQRRAGLPELGIHSLRHTALTRLAMRGADPRLLQRFARHRNFKTTAAYLHVLPGHLEATVRAALAPGAGPQAPSQTKPTES